MRKTIAVFLLISSLLATFFSCAKSLDAEAMLTEFTELYTAVGTVYTPTAKEGDAGYIDDELFRKIYIFEGDIPERFALLLNYHADFGAECGVFISYSSEERERLVEMCTERIRLVGRGGDGAFITVTGPVIFYSTMPDRARVEGIWSKIIRAHT